MNEPLYKYVYLVVETSNGAKLGVGDLVIENEDCGLICILDSEKHGDMHVTMIRLGAFENKLLRLWVVDVINDIIRSWLWARLRSVIIASREIAEEVGVPAHKIRNASVIALNKICKR